MKRTVVILTMVMTFLGLNAHGQQPVLFVKSGVQGNGSSWVNALPNLQAALAIAQEGQEIWVAAGTYKPTKTNDRNASFVIPNGVRLYGGFAGNETALDQRNFDLNPTILSGEIGDPSEEDNSYTIVLTKGVNAGTIVDGFVIKGANANAQVKEGQHGSSGGGWFNDASNADSNPNIVNCRFEDNKAFFGAGLYNFAFGGTTNAQIRDCEFIDNVAKFDGGGILNNGKNGKCNVIIEYSIFEGNKAYYGAGIMNKAEAGESNPYINNTLFKENVALMRGSGVYNLRGTTGMCNPIMKGCRFEDNTESVGKAVSSNKDASPVAKKPRRTILIRPTY